MENELLKYGGNEVAKILKNTMNESFETGQKLQSIGEGFLIPIPKPKKEPSTTNLRPIILLNGVRKILSMITLRRIEEKIIEYTGEEQHRYRVG